MKNTLIIPALLAAGLTLGACSKDSQPESAPATTATAPEAPPVANHPMTPATAPPQAQPTPAATSASYEIPPFPISNIEICDRYASEARRCLNQYATDEQRHAYERDISSLLQKVTPKEGQAPNEWLTSDCRRGLGTLAQKFRQCGIQK